MATPKSPKAITVPQLIEDLKAAFPGTDDFPKMPIVESVLLAILRENHNLQDALRAMARFRSDYVDLNELRVSEIKEYQEIIGPLADSEARARSIRRFLRELFKHNYKFDIDGIAKKTFKEAKDDLKHYEALKHDHHLAHVQVQTLGGHAFPVDQRVLQMARRLGIVDQNADASTLRGILEKNIPKAQILQAIALVERFVNSVCTLTEPKCPTCRFHTFCPGYQLILNPPKPQPVKKPPASAKAKPAAKNPAAAAPAKEESKSKSSPKPETAKAVKAKPAATAAAPESPKTKPAAAKPEAKPAVKSAPAKPEAAPKPPAAPAKPKAAPVKAAVKPAKTEEAPKPAAKPTPKAATKSAPKPETKAAAKPADSTDKAKKPVPKKSK